MLLRATSCHAARVRILIIDDKPILRDTIHQVLEEEGHEALAAADGSEGLQLFQEQRPAVVLTDMLMPGGSFP